MGHLHGLPHGGRHGGAAAGPGHEVSWRVGGWVAKVERRADTCVPVWGVVYRILQPPCNFAAT